MDEYDEMYGIEDDFESQFADELEVLAEIDTDSRPLPKKSERRTRVPTSFEEALASGDSVLRTQPAVKSQKASPDDLETLNKCDSSLPSKVSENDYLENLLASEGSLTPKAKRQRQDVVKKLKFDSADDGKEITPPSSPEEYPSEIRSQNSHGDSRTPAVTPGALDISGLEVLQASPQRAVRAAQHILHRPPPVGDFISVTGSSGDRVYLAKREDEDAGRASDGLAFRRSQYSLGLLSVPIEVLKEQVAERRHQQLVEESQRLTKMLNSQVDQEFGEMDSEEPAEGKGAQDEGGKDAASRLWVDKYSPAHYTELLSDDFTNRCLLKWLKLWDMVVFGREKSTQKPRPTHTDSRTQKDQQTSRFKTKTQMTEEILEAELDQYHRPKYKVALLSGPPGLGKTTLAHVIARHAGYNVVEMNASDDRSAELFQKRIDTATQMKSVLGANERPNCLVIDEIDGAPSAAINVLLAIMNRKETRDTEPVAGGGISSALKKKKKESILMRPIICICNDLYVPALRQLRQQAFLLSFPLTQPSRLVQRLVEISRCQGMRVDTGALMALCEKTENDIRSCINTLQFLHGRGQRQLDQRTVQSVQVGLKDQNKGLFSIWQEIFQLPRTKRKRVGDDLFAVVPDGGLGSAGAQRLQHILHLATSCGEHEKLTNGLYDNFLSMKLKDSSLQAVCMALDWLAFSDLLGEAVMHNQNFSLLRYLPFLPGAFHLLFAATSVPRINYPNSHYEAVTRMQQTRNALVAMLAEVPPSIRSRVGPRSLSLEVLSLLLEVVCPKLRPVNPQLYSTREKQQLVELIDTMMCYNLTYRQDRTPEGQYRYLLEPNVEDAVRFPGVPPRRQLTYQAKQMIARELELEKMRRAEAVLLARNPLPKEEEEGKAKTKADPKSREKRLPMENHRQRLETILKQNVVESKPEVDFFGRAIVPRVKPELTAASAEGEKTMTAEQLMGKAVGNSDVWFRFNEGVSNAVRRNVYIKDLL
nr:chromosome transmission fidelity protein 18 homolog isoform X2 [Paramormyrops kingsleyae]